MPAPIPAPGPDEPPVGAPGPQACDGWGGPGGAWAPGSAGAGPVPRCEPPGPHPDLPSADGVPAGAGVAAPGAAPAAAAGPGTGPGGAGGELARRLGGPAG